MQEMPPATEERLNTPQSYGRMAWAAARVEFQRNQSQLIGGHSFPRAKKGTRQTVVPTKAYSKEDTKRILGACKSQGTTIAHAFFALANIAHMKVTARAADSDPWAAGKKKDLPTMLYSALNLRPHLSKGPGEAEGISQDFFHLAIGKLCLLESCVPPAHALVFVHTFRLLQHCASLVSAEGAQPGPDLLASYKRDERADHQGGQVTMVAAAK